MHSTSYKNNFFIIYTWTQIISFILFFLSYILSQNKHGYIYARWRLAKLSDYNLMAYLFLLF